MSDDFVLPEVVQPGNVGDGLGSLVTRQGGLPPDPTPVTDPVVLPAIIQPGDGTEVRRNVGIGFYGTDGTFYTEGPVQDGTIYVDGPMSAQQLPPPGIARTNQPMPPRDAFIAPAIQQPDRAAIRAMAEAMGFVVSEAPAGAPVVGVVASDQPGDAYDPRDRSSGPQVISALPVIAKRPVVPLVLPTPKVRRVKAKAAPKAAAKKR